MNQTKIVEQSKLEYVESLISAAADAEQRNTEEALKLATEALELSRRYSFIKQEARSLLRIGRCHWINSHFNEALEFLGQSLDISDRVQEQFTKVESLIGIGNVYITLELVDQSMTHYQNALNIALDNGFGELISKIYNNIGTMHEDLKNYEVALDYYQKSLDKSIEIDDQYAIAIANVNIANVNYSLNNLEEAKIFASKAIQYGVENQKRLLLAHSYHSMGRILAKSKAYKESIKYLLIAIDEAKESKDMVILFKSYMELGSSYDENGDYDSAVDEYNNAFELSHTIDLDEQMPRFYEQVGIFYEKHSKFDLAYDYLKKYYYASKIVEENRRKERIKSIEYQSKLSESLEETKIYRQLSNELRKSYQSMHVLSTIGQAMTSSHNLSDIFEQLYENVNLLMNAESIGVGLYDENINALRFDLFIEKGKLLDSFTLSLDNTKSYHVWSFLNKQTIKINDIEKEYKKYIKGLSATRGDLMHSAMYAPLMSEGEVIGVFSIQTKLKNAYTDTHKDLLQTLAAYLAIAIKNAIKTKELAFLNQKFKNLSEQDGLTGIPNRRLFDTVYNKLWNEAIENKQCMSFLMIDIDNFKDFNDHYGHLTGDEVVKKVSDILHSERKNDNDFVARYGGDEFVILLPNHNKEQAEEYANEVKGKIASLNESLNIRVPISISIGIATTTPNATKSKERFLALADAQMYVSKGNGKNCISSTEY